jgi:hypothetical protein
MTMLSNYLSGLSDFMSHEFTSGVCGYTGILLTFNNKAGLPIIGITVKL